MLYTVLCSGDMIQNQSKFDHRVRGLKNKSVFPGWPGIETQSMVGRLRAISPGQLGGHQITGIKITNLGSFTITNLLHLVETSKQTRNIKIIF